MGGSIEELMDLWIDELLDGVRECIEECIGV